jgi:hypothetical protein
LITHFHFAVNVARFWVAVMACMRTFASHWEATKRA